MSCACFTGFACEDQQGGCTCVDSPKMCGNEGGIKPIPDGNGIYAPFPQAVQYWTRANASAAASANTQCAGLAAPKGYKYIYTANGCVLAVDYDSDTTLFGSKGIGSGIIGDIQNAINGNDFLQNNKTLLAVGAAGLAAWFMFGKGMKPKSRVVESRTRY